jgi:dipeptidyl aminopeptidase/acylaminoacyl peptidase
MRQYTPEMAVDLQMASDVQVSPDGSQVAYCVAPIGHVDRNPAGAIFVAPADGSAAPRAVTGREHNNVAPRWSPDGTTLAFLSDRPKRGEAQLHVVPAAGGEPIRLTNLSGGVALPAWSRDGQHIAFTATRKALAGEAESNSEIKVYGERGKPRALAAVAPTGGPPTLLGPTTGHVWAYAEAPEGGRYAALVSPTDLLDEAADNTWLTLFDGSGGSERQLARFARSGDRLVWSPDGRYVATINALRPDRDYSAIVVVDVETGAATSLLDRDLSPNWIAFDGDTLLVHNVEGQRTRLDRTDPIGAEWESIELPEALNERWILPQLSVSADGSTLGLLAAGATRPPEVFAWRAGQATRISDLFSDHMPVQLTNLNPQLDGVVLSEMEELSWQGADGLPVRGWLLLPPGRTGSGRLPLVVNVHGGPSWQWGNWFHGTWHDWGQALTTRGFAVLLPNPRGSTGGGERFESANRSDLGGLDFQDVMLGVDLLIERGVADPERLGIGGWSYGGFLTAWAVTQTARFKAAVAGAAVTNWPSKVGTTDIRPYNESNFPGPLHETPDALWERSPVRYLKNVKTPTLIVHGEADVRVPVTQGYEFYLGVKAVGVETEFVSYPRQGHAFHERAFQLDLLKRVGDWFEKYLK